MYYNLTEDELLALRAKMRRACDKYADVYDGAAFGEGWEVRFDIINLLLSHHLAGV